MGKCIHACMHEHSHYVITYMQCNGKEISWTHLMTLYERNRSDSGLVLCPKLKFEHLNLTSFSKMRVDLAAQVLLFHAMMY